VLTKSNLRDKFFFMIPLGPEATSLPASAGFHTTHWTVVLTARDNNGDAAREALATLCSTYWYPLYAFVRRQPAAGKFRSFLLTCLKNFLANQRERASAQRRGGGRQLIHLDARDAETRYSLEPVDNLTPDAVFERRWAFTVLERTIKELRREYEREEKRAHFEELQGFLPGGQGSTSRAELAAKRGVTAGAIDVAVHRLRHRFGVLLREQVAQTVSSVDDVEEEIRYLILVLST
jgi:DNA-directed RNA polymerase specialized sigma24 family protein